MPQTFGETAFDFVTFLAGAQGSDTGAKRGIGNLELRADMPRCGDLMIRSCPLSEATRIMGRRSPGRAELAVRARADGWRLP